MATSVGSVILVFIQAHSAWPSLRAWVNTTSTGDGFGHRWWRNGEFCVSAGTATGHQSSITRGQHLLRITSKRFWPMGGASGVTGGSCPCAPCRAPTAAVVVRKKYMCPLDPSRPLSQRKFYVEIHEMCQNTAQWKCWISFHFRSLTIKATGGSFPPFKVR